MHSEARGIGVGRADVQRGAVRVERVLVVPGDLQGALSLGPGLGQDLVLARGIEVAVVREVPHVGDVLAARDQQPVPLGGAPDQVGQQVGTQVPDVRVAVHGRAAGVDAETATAGGLDLLELPGPGVIETEHTRQPRVAAGPGQAAPAARGVGQPAVSTRVALTSPRSAPIPTAVQPGLTPHQTELRTFTSFLERFALDWVTQDVPFQA